MLGAMTVQRESFRRKKRAKVTKKEQCCSQKEQSEMWGIIRKGQLRTGRGCLMLFRCDYAGIKITIFY